MPQRLHRRRHHFSPSASKTQSRHRRATLLAGAVGLVLVASSAQGTGLTWDPAASNGATPGGAGAWDATSPFWFNGSTDVAWPNTSPNADEAIFTGAAGGTVTLGAPIQANALTFSTDGYVIAGSGSNNLTLSGTTPTITVDPVIGAVISAPITGSAGLVKAGAGTLQLSGSNSFTGGLTVNGGAIAFTADNNLGTGSVNTGITLNNAMLSYVGTTGGPTINKVITINGSGTLNSAANAGGGKWVLNNGGKLAGNGTLYKTGPGWLTIYGGAVAGSTFGTEVDGGVIEMGNANALGAGSITLKGGEVSMNTSTAFTNEVYVNSGDTGTFACDGGNYTYAGNFHADGDVTIRLGDFWGAGARNMTFSGSSALLGSGTIGFASGSGAQPSGQLLTVAGNTNFFSGTMNVSGGYGVLFSNGVPFGATINASASATALPVIATGVDELPAFNVVDQTSGTGGVYAYGNTTTTQTLDMSSIYGGNWYLGAVGTGTYAGSSLGAGTASTYRLGGGGGKLVIANANVITGGNDVNVGTTMVNGRGTVQLLQPQNYTGATNVVNGTLTIGADNAIPASSAITLGGVNGTTLYAGAIDVGGFSQSFGQPLNVAAGADPAGQVITNNGGSTGTAVFDTSAGPTTWAGQFKDGAKSLAVSVSGSNPANGLTLSNGSVNFTGGAAVNGVTLTVGAGNGAKMSGPVALSNGGKLVLNSTENLALGVVSGNGQVVHSGSGNVTLGAPNTFSGGVTINGGGTVTAGISAGGNVLGSGPITLSGGKLALQGQQVSSGTVQPLAPVTGLSGFNRDTIYAVGDTKYFPNNKDRAGTGGQANDANNSLQDAFYTYYENGFGPAESGMLNYTNPKTPLGTGSGSGGLPSGGLVNSQITNTVTGGNTPFQLQSYTANNTLQILGGKNGFHQGTLSLDTPSGFKNLSVLSVSSWATTDTPNVTINFTDGTSVSTTYKTYDWLVGTDSTKAAADAMGGLLNRYSPFQAVAAGNGTGGWDSRNFGLYETDIDLTNINGVDYSGKIVSSLTFDGLMTNTAQDQRTNIFAVSGQAIPLITTPTQSFGNDVTVTADSGIDVTGSLDATMGNLNMGAARLSVTSGDTTTNPYSLTFGATTLNGAAAFDVASSAGGGAGKLVLGPVSGTGSVTKTGAGTLRLTGASTITGGLVANGGNVDVAANTSLGSLGGDGTGSLNVLGSAAVTVAAHGAAPAGVAKLGGLSIASGATLDIADNHLVVDYADGGASPLNEVKAMIATGYNGGSWSGTGLTSSSAAAAASAAHKTALGYGEASTVLGASGGTFAGVSVDGSAVIVRYTYTGDANLDGKVDTLDFNSLAANFGGSDKIWTQADFNFDGKVDTLDFNNLAANFGQQMAASDAAAASTAGAGVGSLVPEPGSFSLLALGAVSLLARRRRGA